MPWVHFHVTQYGTVTPCCQTPWQREKAFGDINTQSIEEIWNSPGITDFRKTIMSGKTDERCKNCFKREENGFTSLRQITNKKYSHKNQRAIESRNENFKVHQSPVYFDIRFSNVCNLRCRICGPWSSSSWYNDALQLGMLTPEKPAITQAFTNIEKFFNEFENTIDYLEELYFAGGEPLVIEEHYSLLNLLIARNKTNVKLTYNTNFSSFRYKNYNVLELWKKFPNISIAASLDAEGERGEFLRKNIVWEKVIENRKLIQKELPHLEFIVSPTINIYNLLHLPDFHKSWVTKELISVEDFIPTLLVVPEELSVQLLPLGMRNKAKHIYIQHLEWIKSRAFKNEEKQKHMLQQFENIIRSLESGAECSLEKFEKNLKALDKIRNENTKEIFPELNEFFKG